tara:strand:+ start:94528 stop:94695 length:168 start_codon:yes stop_codon:yes gene_type:complete
MKTISSGASAEDPACGLLAEEVLLVGVEQEKSTPAVRIEIQSLLIIKEHILQWAN